MPKTPHRTKPNVTTTAQLYFSAYQPQQEMTGPSAASKTQTDGRQHPHQLGRYTNKGKPQSKTQTYTITPTFQDNPEHLLKPQQQRRSRQTRHQQHATVFSYQRPLKAHPNLHKQVTTPSHNHICNLTPNSQQDTRLCEDHWHRQHDRLLEATP